MCRGSTSEYVCDRKTRTLGYGDPDDICRCCAVGVIPGRHLDERLLRRCEYTRRVVSSRLRTLQKMWSHDMAMRKYVSSNSRDVKSWTPGPCSFFVYLRLASVLQKSFKKVNEKSRQSRGRSGFDHVVLRDCAD
jgi:hypothetical protein